MPRRERTPLHEAAKSGDVDKVRKLSEGGRYNVDCVDRNGWRPLHEAASRGHVDVVRVLVSEFSANVNARTDSGDTPLHLAASKGHLGVVKMLLSESSTDADVCNFNHSTSLYLAIKNNREEVAQYMILMGHCDTKRAISCLQAACKTGSVNLVQALVQKHGTSILNSEGDVTTLLHHAIVDKSYGHEVAVTLVKEFSGGVKDCKGQSLMHIACQVGDVSLVQTLILEGKADVTASNNKGNTPLHIAARSWSKNAVSLVRTLILDGKADDTARNNEGNTPLHIAARSRNQNAVSVVQTLILDGKADVTARDNEGNTPLHVAVMSNRENVLLALIDELGCDVNVKGQLGRSPLHTACLTGNYSLVRLISKHATNTLGMVDDNGDTPFDVAVNICSEELALVLMNEFHCDTKGGTPYIHTSCKKGWVNLVRVLVQKHGTSILMDNYADNGNTPFDVAINNHSEEVALALNEFHCDTKGGTPYIHTACKNGWVKLVQALVQKHGTDILKYKVGETTLLHKIVRYSYLHKVAVMLIKKFGTDVKDLNGQSLLHIAGKEDDVSLVQTLIRDGKADVTARDDAGNTPLHVAARSGREDVVLALIDEIGCDVTVQGQLGRSPLHTACLTGNSSLARMISKRFPSTVWMVDDNGDTPLHVCARSGHTHFKCVKTLLELDPPVMVRNNLGQTPKDVAEKYAESHLYSGSYKCIDTYMKKNKGKIKSHYNLQKHMPKRSTLFLSLSLEHL